MNKSKVNFSLDNFKAGEVAIKVNKNNIMDCIKLLQKFDLNWIGGNELFNPFTSNPSKEYLYLCCIPEYTNALVYIKDIEDNTCFEKIVEWQEE